MPLPPPVTMTVRPVKSKRAFMLVPLDGALTLHAAPRRRQAYRKLWRRAAARNAQRCIARARSTYNARDGHFRDSRRRRRAPAFPAGAALPRARAASDRRRHAARAAAGVGGARAQRAGRSAVHLLANSDREDRLAARPRR